ncbi:Adenylate cyclase 2 [Marinobacterium sp. xm-d-543]|uniref:CHASE2 domain-containing protein n=1 Tax=Marinobacterium sp. xm-d-543 TaxID=2497740 RepID=UPI001569F28A|nr:adenylate/guanylate cyclase domain-containing protein [Marinobacterium sp. xm-d-543]NRP46010.1 Adenylate cyclase 2 [Marinobacterium sp. xm-d-543]
MNTAKAKSTISIVEHMSGIGRLKLRAMSALIVLAILFSLMLFSPGLLSSLNRSIDDVSWRFLASPDTKLEPVVIAIDEKSLDKVGAWPWSRDTLADLSQALAHYEVKKQMFDIVFPESKKGDARLKSVLLRNDAIIGQIGFANGEGGARKGAMTHALSNVTCGAGTYPASGFLANNQSLQDVNKGHITPLIGPDGVVRQVPSLLCLDGLVYPSLSLTFKMAESNNTTVAIEKNTSFWGPAYWLGLSNDSAKVPVGDMGELQVPYHAKPGNVQTYSAVDVLSKKIPPELLKGRIALVGGTAFGLGDVLPTPFSGAAAGVELQARLVDALMQERYVYIPSFEALMLLALVIALMLPSWLFKSQTGGVAVWVYPSLVLITPLFLFVVKVTLLKTLGAQLQIAGAVLFVIVTNLFFTLIEYLITLRDRGRLMVNLSAYLPGSVSNKIGLVAPTGYVEAQREERVMMSVDIRNFSMYEESRFPEETAALLHSFLTTASGEVEHSGGTIEELKGDSVLASWPAGQVDGALIVNTAKDLHRKVTGLLVSTTGAEIPLAVGIGIEKGSVLVGSIGPSNRKVHTILGEAVTQVIRIQEMTEELAQPILIGPEFVSMLDGNDVDDHGSFLLPGMRKSRRLYSPCSKIEDSWEQLENHLKVYQGGKS